jgi:type I restriction enzyme M protein
MLCFGVFWEAGSEMHPVDIYREIRNFLAGQFVGATRDETILAEVVKCLFVRQHLVEYDAFPFPRGNAVEAAKYFRKAFRDVLRKYPEFFGEDEELLLGAEELTWTLRRLWEVELQRTDRDLVGDAFEVFVGSALRGQEGQFFTPRNAIRFLVEAVDPKPGELVIDPACGSGGFLSLVHLKTKEKGSARVYGIDKDTYLAKLARMHMALMGADHTHIYNTDSIAVHNGLKSPDKTLPSEGTYDVVLTNPPFGSKIVGAKPEVAARYEVARKWKYDTVAKRWAQTQVVASRIPPQLLFLEKCVRLLRPGGRCGMVVPESLITSAQYRFAVQYLQNECRIRIVAGMPEALFKTSGKGGTHTKTCLLVFDKKKQRSEQQSSKVFFAEAKWCGNDSRGRAIDKDDLNVILNNYSKGQKAADKDLLGFWIAPRNIEDYSLCPRRYDPRITNTLNAMEESHDIVKFGDLVTGGRLEVVSGDEVGKMAYGTGDIPFVRTSDLSNWEIKTDPKHGLSKEVYEKLKDKQDVREGDILMVKDGTYLIGTCAIISSYDLRIVYQSHLYKIRVVNPDGYLDPYLLLAILGSDVVKSQILSKRVTHDIIDSLGARINELLLPIPKNAQKRRSVSRMVKKVVNERVEARELARRAREMVAMA